MALRFEWSQEYSVGHSVIDEQHRKLFELGNAVNGADLDEAVYFLDKLYDYARMHFEFEEKQMKSVNYPAYFRHIELHNELLSRLHEISKYPFEAEDDFFQFKKFIYDWIIDHIMREDRKFADYVQAMS